MGNDIWEYCNNYDNCPRTRSPRHVKHGLHHPLELPSKPCARITPDFGTDLLESNGNEIVLVVVDQFTKIAHYIPLGTTDSHTVAKAYLDNVWKYDGFPEDIVSDRDGTFMGQYFTVLYNLLEIHRSMCTAFHLQTDGQTAWFTQVIEAYLGPTCNIKQNDPAEMLLMGECSYNNSKHLSTNISLSYAMYHLEQRMTWPTEIQFRNPTFELYGDYMTEVFTQLCNQLVKVRETMGVYYQKKRKLIKRFEKGELVKLNKKNIQSSNQCMKLEDAINWPLEVLFVTTNQRDRKITLPESWKIHPGCNKDYLNDTEGAIQARRELRLRRMMPDRGMEKFIASEPSNMDNSKHIYLIKWDGYSQN